MRFDCISKYKCFSHLMPRSDNSSFRIILSIKSIFFINSSKLKLVKRLIRNSMRSVKSSSSCDKSMLSWVKTSNNVGLGEAIWKPPPTNYWKQILMIKVSKQWIKWQLNMSLLMRHVKSFGSVGSHNIWQWVQITPEKHFSSWTRKLIYSVSPNSIKKE